MSRIGAKAIEIPSGVTVEVKQGIVHVTGPKGTLTYVLLPEVGAQVEGNMVKIIRVKENSDAKARHGLARSLISNMITLKKTTMIIIRWYQKRTVSSKDD